MQSARPHARQQRPCQTRTEAIDRTLEYAQNEHRLLELVDRSTCDEGRCERAISCCYIGQEAQVQHGRTRALSTRGVCIMHTYTIWN